MSGLFPAPGDSCINPWFPECIGNYILYTEGELAGLLECSRCGHTPNGAAYTDDTKTAPAVNWNKTAEKLREVHAQAEAAVPDALREINARVRDARRRNTEGKQE